MTNKEVIPFSRFFLLANKSGLRRHVKNLQEIARRHQAKIFQKQGSRRLEWTGRRNSFGGNY